MKFPSSINVQKSVMTEGLSIAVPDIRMRQVRLRIHAVRRRRRHGNSRHAAAHQCAAGPVFARRSSPYRIASSISPSTCLGSPCGSFSSTSMRVSDDSCPSDSIVQSPATLVEESHEVSGKETTRADAGNDEAKQGTPNTDRFASWPHDFQMQ